MSSGKIPAELCLAPKVFTWKFGVCEVHRSGGWRWRFCAHPRQARLEGLNRLADGRLVLQKHHTKACFEICTYMYYVSVDAHSYVEVHMYVYIYMYMRTYSYTCIYVYVYAYVHAYIYK